MKIYILPVEPQKPSKIRAFPQHSIGFNVETSFLGYLKQNDHLLTKNPDEADWHYLPVMWSYWQLSNNYGRDNRDKMQEMLDKIIIDKSKTFTVTEADNEPDFNNGKMVVFSANSGGNWIPLGIITLPHQLPTVRPEKKYLSNFVGNIKPWPTRMKMVELLSSREDVKIIQSKKGEELFVNTILESYSTLCPRGSALGSYRFYESMQLGVVPIMISDYDFRPFPDRINWNTCSYFLDDVNKLPELLDSLDKHELEMMGHNAEAVWKRLFNEWPEYVIDHLRKL